MRRRSGSKPKTGLTRPNASTLSQTVGVSRTTARGPCLRCTSRGEHLFAQTRVISNSTTSALSADTAVSSKKYFLVYRAEGEKTHFVQIQFLHRQ